ncbi:MAG TPA: hypothetical protein VF079_10715 [Sphingomicrobium sp.]
MVIPSIAEEAGAWSTCNAAGLRFAAARFLAGAFFFGAAFFAAGFFFAAGLLGIGICMPGMCRCWAAAGTGRPASARALTVTVRMVFTE